MIQLTGKEISYFIKTYGDGDVYYSHEYNEDCIIVKYFPAINNFMEQESITMLKDELKNRPDLEKKYLNTIALKETCAEIIDGAVSCPSLVKKYKQFLKDLHEKKYSTKKPFSYLENFANNNVHSTQTHNHKKNGYKKNNHNKSNYHSK